MDRKREAFFLLGLASFLIIFNAFIFFGTSLFKAEDSFGKEVNFDGFKESLLKLQENANAGASYLDYSVNGNSNSRDGGKSSGSSGGSGGPESENSDLDNSIDSNILDDDSNYEKYSGLDRFEVLSSSNNGPYVEYEIFDKKENTIEAVSVRAMDGIDPKESLNRLLFKEIAEEEIAGSYIVEFDEPSVLEALNEAYNDREGSVGILTVNSVDENLLASSQKAKIQELHNRLRDDLAGKNKGFFSLNNQESKVEKEFSLAFSGASVKLTRNELEMLKEKDYVKEIHEEGLVFSDLYYSVPQIGAPSVWGMQDNQERNITGQGIKIAILDTGIDYNHSDLGGCFGSECKVIGGWDFVNKDNNPIDDHGHGTHVAAIAAGKDTVGNGLYNGVAPDASLLAYKVINYYGIGKDSDILDGIEMALDPDEDGDFSDAADVMSMSFGGAGNPDDPLSQAVDNAVENGVVVVVSAGNSGPYEQTIGSPGVARKAITVGAVDDWNNLVYFSSRGPVIHNGEVIAKPDIVAPGYIICAAKANGTQLGSSCSNGNRVYLSGTSMAAPHVSGAAALLLQQNPWFTPENIKSALQIGGQSSSYYEYYDYYMEENPFESGAGALNVAVSANTNILFNPTILNFGMMNQSEGTWRKTIPLTITNLDELDFIVPEVNSTIEGIYFEYEKNITLPGNSSKTINVTISVNASDFEGQTYIYGKAAPENSNGLPFVLIKPEVHIGVNREITNYDLDIFVDLHPLPLNLTIEVETPEGNISDIPYNKSDTIHWTNYRPNGREGEYVIRAKANYKDFEVVKEKRFVFDRTKPDLDIYNGEGNIVLTSDEIIEPHFLGNQVLKKTPYAYEYGYSYSASQGIEANGEFFIFTGETFYYGYKMNHAIYKIDSDTGKAEKVANRTLDSWWLSGLELFKDMDGEVYYVYGELNYTENSTDYDRSIHLFHYNKSSNSLDPMGNYALAQGSALYFGNFQVFVDKNNDFNIFFTSYDNNTLNLNYIKTNSQGEKISNGTLINGCSMQSSYYYDIAVDSSGIAHAFCTGVPTKYASFDPITENVSQTSNIWEIVDEVEYSNGDLHTISYDWNRYNISFGVFDPVTKAITKTDYLYFGGMNSKLVIDAAGNQYFAGRDLYWENDYLYRRDAVSGEITEINWADNFFFQGIWHTVSDILILDGMSPVLIDNPYFCEGGCVLRRGLSYNIYSHPSAKADGEYIPISYQGENMYSIDNEYLIEKSNLTLKASDLAGNKQARTVNLNEDFTKPSVYAYLYEGDGSIEIMAEAEDTRSGIKEIRLAVKALNSSGGIVWSDSIACTDSPCVYSINENGNLEYFYTAVAWDNSGNKGTILDFTEQETFGDVNSDGIITALDGLYVLSHVVNKTELTGYQIFVSDTNFNGVVEEEDADLVLKHVVQLIELPKIKWKIFGIIS